MNRAYLDHNATTPIRTEAAQAVLHALSVVGNPSAVHAEGRAARKLIEDARSDVAQLVNASPKEVTFTSGGTEAANFALHSVHHMGITRIILSAAEHDALRKPAERTGIEVLVAPVDRNGRLDLAAYESLLKASDQRTLVVLMLASNETGVIQPVAEAAALAHRENALLLCDATQAAGKIDVDFLSIQADMLLLAGHKLGGPLGVGALVARDALQITALQLGGGQERFRRAGSENLPGIAGFGAAARAAALDLDRFAMLANIRDEFESNISRAAPDAEFFGSRVPRLPNTSFFSAPGLDAATIVMALDLDGVAVSAGAACSSGKVKSPRVLNAMNVDEALARGAIRMSLGRDSTSEETQKLANAWLRVYGNARVRARELASVES
jgi:cysteine desulfurase